MKYVLKYIDLFLFSTHGFFQHIGREDNWMAKYSTAMLLTVIFTSIVLLIGMGNNLPPFNIDLSSRRMEYLFIFTLTAIVGIPSFILVWKRYKYYYSEPYSYGKKHIYYFAVVIAVWLIGLVSSISYVVS
jgi:hypothetical protein